MKNETPMPPADLLSLQTWFGGIITRALGENNQIEPIAPSGRPLSEEAAEFVSSGPNLTADQKMEIYNRQYWWRLISILHENFPGLTRLFGYEDFNRSIAVPFLVEHPPKHWSLSKLGDTLENWLLMRYTAADKLLVSHMAALDFAYQSVFFAPTPVLLAVEMDLISTPLTLQGHVKLFKLPFDLFSFRSSLIKEDVEFWIESDFPTLSKGRDYFFVLYRDRDNLLSYREIQEGQWALLEGISRGLTLQESCDCLEEAGGEGANEARSFLAQWIQEWIHRNWLNKRY